MESGIKPRDIDISTHFFDAFGNFEREVSARWIVMLLQEKNPDKWESFTHSEIEEFYNKYDHENFYFNGIDDYLVIIDDSDEYLYYNPRYAVTMAFINRCYHSSDDERRKKLCEYEIKRIRLEGITTKDVRDFLELANKFEDMKVVD